MVRVGAEKPPVGQDGEGCLPVRVVLEAFQAVAFPRHQGLQVGLHDLPVEGQLHVPVGASGAILPGPVS